MNISSSISRIRALCNYKLNTINNDSDTVQYHSIRFDTVKRGDRTPSSDGAPKVEKLQWKQRGRSLSTKICLIFVAITRFQIHHPEETLIWTLIISHGESSTKKNLNTLRLRELEDGF